MSELAASTVMARPGRLAALVWVAVAVLLSGFVLACADELHSTPSPPSLTVRATATPEAVKATATPAAATLPPLPPLPPTPTPTPRFGNAPTPTPGATGRRYPFAPATPEPTREPAATPTPIPTPTTEPTATPQPIAQPIPEPLRPGGQLTAAAWLDADRMYLADWKGDIRLLNVVTGEVKTALEGLSIPQGLTVLAGRLYVSEMGNVCELQPTAKEKAQCKGDELGLAVLTQSSARILSYRIGPDGELDDQQIVVDRILSFERDHSPNGLTNDGEWIYVSIGHPYGGQPDPQGNYITAAAAELAAAGGRSDLMGVIARFRPGDAEVEVYATGFRNTYGISMGPDGVLYGADNDTEDGLAKAGQLEELNAIVQGGFYGYPFWGSYEAGAAVGVREPAAILQGTTSTFAYANEQGVYVAYLSLSDSAGAGAEGFVVDRFDYETFTPTRIVRGAPGHVTAILERQGLLYLATFSGVILVIDPNSVPSEQLARYEVGIAVAEDKIIAQQEPNLIVNYTVYWHNGELLYVQDPCGPEGMRRWFFLSIVPVNPADLADDRKEYGFESRDFRFDEYGIRHRGRCLATVPLPAYDILKIRTGSGADFRPE